MRKTRSLQERFDEKTMPEPNTGCLLWLGCVSPAGYGRIWDGRKVQEAHIVAYEMKYGPVPNGLELDHKCRVRSCVNADHVEPVTHRVNCLRGEAPVAVNAKKTTCPKGHTYDYSWDGRAVWRGCSTCRNEYNATYGAAHRDEQRVRNTLYQAAHRDELRTYNARYQVTHREEIKARKLRRREENRASQAY